MVFIYKPKKVVTRTTAPLPPSTFGDASMNHNMGLSLHLGLLKVMLLSYTIECYTFFSGNMKRHTMQEPV